MKQVKVAFLFFVLFSFLSCEKQDDKSENDSKQKSLAKEFFKSAAYKKSSNAKRLENSKIFISDNKLNSTDKYLMYNNISYLSSKLNKIDSAIFYSKKMLRLPSVENDINLKGKVYYKLGIYQYKKNAQDSSYFFYAKSKNEFLKLKDSVSVGKSLSNLAIIESNFGSYSLSDSLAVESLKFFNGKEPKTMASSLNCLAINAKKRSFYNEAIAYYISALKITTRKSSKIRFRNNLAIAHKELKNYKKSILIFEELLQDTITSQKTKTRVIDNLAYVKWLENSDVNVLKELLFANSKKLQLKDNYGLIANYSHLSDYFQEKNRKKSLQYAIEMYKISRKVKSIQDVLEAIDKIVERQPPEKAIKYYKESIYLRDSLQEAETKRQFRFAKIKYNYDEEEKLKEKFRNLAIENELKVEKENSQKKNSIIIGILLISGLLFLLYRRKQLHKKRVLQESYNTETRIAKRLHDELGNDVFNTLVKVQNPKINTLEIIDDLDKIYHQTRSISHENNAIKTGDKFESYFRHLVASYNTNDCKIIIKGLSDIHLNNLAAEKQIVVYRIFNELFVNMKKHSKASLVMLTFTKKNSRIEMIYFDNGIGFEKENIVHKNGLKNMETRIKTINGTINFENKPGKGLKVSIHFKS